VLVNDLQGLGLKVELLADNEIVDAEEVLAQNIKEEAKTATPAAEGPSVLDQAIITDEVVANDLAIADDAGMSLMDTENEIEDLENRTIEEEA
jgi:hypothetical protein